METNIAVGEHRDLLDIIDNLRLQGVSHYVALPEIIVCGDQYAGKSSVLEAISGMPFPIKDGLCTRFATELVLRRGDKANIKVSITPGETRFGEDKERLESWQPKSSIDGDGLGAVTEEAESAMAFTSVTEFYDDTLRIELTGPGQPHLTMVDLPGLFRGGNKKQSDADGSIVHDMVQKYMERPRSIILTVVSAKYEYVLQEVTLMAKKADPQGLRTMGLITKPDTLDVGSPSENYFVRLAQNLEAELRLGWHVLKNRSFEERDVTLAERDSIENQFFSQGLWTAVDRSDCGVSALRDRLSRVLRDQILFQLPSLEKDVEDGICDCAERLERLGPVRVTPQQQRSYLLRVSEDYTYLMRQAVDGTYNDRFFGERKSRASFNRRLRAVVRMRLDQFAEEMRLDGQSQQIIDSASEDESSRQLSDTPSISRTDFIDKVAKRLRYSKGRELPGLFNPLVVNDLFVDQCMPWRKITMSLAEDILDAVYGTTERIVEHIAASEVSEGVLKIIRRDIQRLGLEMNAQINDLLTSAAQHPITNNSQLTQNVQRTQQERHKRHMMTLITRMFGQYRFDGLDKKISINPQELLKLSGKSFEPDMERFGSALAVDYMKAYYKVAVDRFIDDVSVLAIEVCLITKLSSLFRSGDVVEMSDEELYLLAGETQESGAKRKRLEVKQRVLEKGLQDLKSLSKRRTVVDFRKQDDIASDDFEKLPTTTQSHSGNPSPAPSSAKAYSVVSSDHPNDISKESVSEVDVRRSLQGGLKDLWLPSMIAEIDREA
jgi:GTP-binding protein EngB required for normal cell division